jgi:signal peptidase I
MITEATLENLQINEEGSDLEQLENKSGLRRFIIDVIETLLLSIILYWGINAITARIRVDGYSMLPTLQSGEYVLVNRLAYHFGDVNRGDVVVFHFPGNKNQEYIKRIIGLPGEKIIVSNGKVFVNGEQLIEPYISDPPRYESTWDVPQNALFVLGDNRNNSSDSHNWGVVKLENVIGKAVLTYWPPQNWGLIDLTGYVKVTQ